MNGLQKIVALCALSFVAHPASALMFSFLGGPGPSLTAQANMRPTINVSSKGLLSVSLVNSATFNVNDVNISSIRFGPGDAPVAGKPQVMNVTSNGQKGLLLEFKTQATGITCGTTEVTLSGHMLNGELFKASTPITTNGC